MDTRLTQLEAINRMLAAVGSSPINALDDPLNADALIAKETLHTAMDEVQSEKWHFNVEYNFPLPINTAGEISVPFNTLGIDFSGFYGMNKRIVIRNGKLYDMTNHTYKFTEALRCNIHYALPFEELPEVAKLYVIVKAARRFQDQVQSDANVHVWTREDEELARARLTSEDLRQTKPSFGLYPRLDPNIGIDIGIAKCL